MAGAKGRSGGARLGAGRPKNKENSGADAVAATPDATPLDVLLAMMNDPSIPVSMRIKAAQAAAPYVHAKQGDGGKKGERSAASKRAAVGKFAPIAAPRLVVNNR